MTIVTPIGLLDLRREGQCRLLYTKSANEADVLFCLELLASPSNWSIGHHTAMLSGAVDILLGYGKYLQHVSWLHRSFMSYSCWVLCGGARFCRDHLLQRTAETVALPKSAAGFSGDDV